MTFKTLTVTSACHSLVWHARSVAEEGGMAAEAVLLYHLLPGFPDVDSLGFPAHGEDCGVAETVTGLEIIFPYEAVMRHMAGIAVSDATVGAV